MMRCVTNWAVGGHISGQRAPVLMVLLPGALHGPEDFIAAGFVSAVRERGLPLDIAMAEMDFREVASETAVHDLNTVLDSLQARDYAEVWLAGISIGGYVSMAYARHYPEDLHGLLLIAPYPGNRMTTGEIHAAGGLANWSPVDIDAADTERLNWLWLKHENRSHEVHLAYGREDRFAASHAMIAQPLPPARVDSVSGGHDWAAWHALWCNFLDRRWKNGSHV
jgi:pimeloyl-ACP methyl ester carboxylesterase